jgi:hypothetical protein
MSTNDTNSDDVAPIAGESSGIGAESDEGLPVGNAGDGTSQFASSPPWTFREKNPYWIRVKPSPAREPYLAACEVCRRYVRRKPMNWKKKEMNAFVRKMMIEPDGRSSMIMSEPMPRPEGAWMVVSQYGGTASAWASAYDFCAKCTAFRAHCYLSDAGGYILEGVPFASLLGPFGRPRPEHELA